LCALPIKASHSVVLIVGVVVLVVDIFLGVCAFAQGGVFESAIQDGPSVKALQKLPTKLELIQKIAAALQMAGAKGIAVRLKKAAGGQLVKAIKMAFAEEEKRDAAGSVIKVVPEVVAE
jgi:hypothetical protein